MLPAAGAGTAGTDHAVRSPAEAEVPRPRLARLLDRRWEVAVTTVVAPGGFGKTTVLRRAVESADGNRGVDLPIRCRPIDAGPVRFTRLVLHALGSTIPTDLEDLDDTGELAGRIVGAMAGRSPTPVCLLVDDVHELEGEPATTAVLVDVIRSLPGNVHLVLAGRSLPPVPLARLRAADQVLELTADTLAFDEQELRDLVERLGADEALVDSLPPWPAVARLAIAAGHHASMEYLREEVLGSLSPPLRRALAVAVLADGLDGPLVAGLCTPTIVDALVDGVPMVERLDDGTVVAHAFWHEVLHQLVDPGELRDLVERIAHTRSEADEHDEAIRLAATHHRWDLVAELVLVAVGRRRSFLSPRTALDWLELVPPQEQDRPQLLVLRGMIARLTTGGTEGHELVATAWEHFRAAGALEDEAVAMSELAWSRWAARDLDTVLAIYERAREIDRVRPGLLDPVVCLVEAAMADLAGDPRGALEAIERIDVGAMVDPGVELLVLNWSASLHVLVGDTTEAVRCSEEAARSAAARDGRPIQTVLAHWFDGNPRPAAANPLGWGESDEHVSARDRFLADVYGAVLSASFGRHFPVELGELRARGASHGRDLVFAAVAVASQLVVAGQEDEAGAVLAEALATCGAHDPLAQVELLRFAPYALVLDPSLTEALVRRALGPAHHRNLALVELFLACRAGRRADWRMLPSPTEVFTALPLPWTLELAAWALRAERPEALEIVDLASELAGPETRAVLRRLAEDDVAGGGAARLLGAVRWTPAQPVRVEVLGPLRVVHGDVPVEGGALRRRRVRELLALLVLRRRATREVAMDLLWPDLDADRARNNLNVNLRWVRTLLEPERSRGEAPFFVRSRGDDLVLLPPSELFSIDLDDAERSIDRARRAEDVGDVEAAATAYESVLELWRGEPFEDLLAVDGTREAREHLRSTLLDAACRAGELRLSTSAIDRALAHAARALDHDPFSERAHGIVVAAHLQRGDLASASRAVERCREAMDTLGVPLGENARMLARQIEARAAEDV